MSEDGFAAGYRAGLVDLAAAEMQAYDAGWREGRSEGYGEGLDDANADAPTARGAGNGGAG